ncbi:hypothetical protein CDD80_5925 [Ophiocordyceps camponoti-rufipedis]|uniref:Uncharacterized protein n=1 Tax=Ophiocordyceps camponoti-rufipedis TaxID=2004952 RepID=A0A2C5YP82_9HYPO|nr:hypothetical protein CDD80_5925 [Ophiocordyceps camponoti-rufipedis]
MLGEFQPLRFTTTAESSSLSLAISASIFPACTAVNPLASSRLGSSPSSSSSSSRCASRRPRCNDSERSEKRVRKSSGSDDDEDGDEDEDASDAGFGDATLPSRRVSSSSSSVITMTDWFLLGVDMLVL